MNKDINYFKIKSAYLIGKQQGILEYKILIAIKMGRPQSEVDALNEELKLLDKAYNDLH